MPIILSTGMSTLAEVEARPCPPCGRVSRGQGKGRLTVGGTALCGRGKQSSRRRSPCCTCTTRIPRALQRRESARDGTLHRAFGLPVGYSDHTPGIFVCIGAVALGATVIEKHFTIDRRAARSRPFGVPRAAAALRDDPRNSRHGTVAGGRTKAPGALRLKNRDVARRSLVAALPIKKGELFSAGNLTAKLAGNWHFADADRRLDRQDGNPRLCGRRS